MFIKILRVFLLSLVVCPFAFGHIMPSGKGTLNINKEKVYVIISLPEQYFMPEGVEKSRLKHSDIKKTFRANFSLQSEKTDAKWDEIIVNGPPKNTENHEYVVMAVAIFPETVKQIKLVSDNWTLNNHAISLKGTLTKDKKISMTEVHVISSLDKTAHFFQDTKRFLFTYFVSGIKHIVFGYDHLVFLLALLAGAVGLLRWCTLLTAFTLGHAISFYVGIRGILMIPPWIIEPTIALSICIISLFHLLSKKKTHLFKEAFLILMVGAIHGFGFAGSLATIGELSSRSISSLLAFNIGIELSQIFITLVFCGLICVLRKSSLSIYELACRNAILILSCLIGLYWFVERLI